MTQKLTCLFLFLLIVVCLAQNSIGGVSQGTPKSEKSLINMKMDYRIQINNDMTFRDIKDLDQLVIDVSYPKKEQGYFIVSEKEPQNTASIVCQKLEVPQSKIKIFWMGKSCLDQYFSDKLKSLSDNVQHIKISP